MSSVYAPPSALVATPHPPPPPTPWFVKYSTTRRRTGSHTASGHQKFIAAAVAPQVAAVLLCRRPRKVQRSMSLRSNGRQVFDRFETTFLSRDQIGVGVVFTVR